ncbi:Ubiquitin family protein [Trichomonas vaginalis G3]|uniref:Ubiquitin family protein n=1 Tax=Trichomonas vaginalis (strain ATCC PRA-98 / G3) TaxID=412133 RepID=A2E9D4_TRIV3|nr:FI07626P-related family [Trichomonas vaginalis G3]EAY10698.1 Ubiquitin family protein [Trichomonas vaginalis G3]KAI5538591.1 FI07626P-related family [Trichomonas vaginalis G3]|eukprot:XP_001322921.1 Ubiquitin family protein [Trichomonas vaginalis G3]
MLKINAVNPITPNEIIDLVLRPLSIVGDIKKQIGENIQTNPKFIKIIYQGRILIDELTLDSYGIQDNATVYYTVSKKALEAEEKKEKVKKPEDYETETLMDKIANSQLGKKMMESIDENPELIQNLFNQIPNFDKAIDDNPDIAYAMKDNDFITDMFRQTTAKGNKRVAALQMDNIVNQVELHPEQISLSRLNGMVDRFYEPLADGMFSEPPIKLVIPTEKPETPSVLPISYTGAAASAINNVKNEIQEGMSKINRGILVLRKRNVSVSKKCYETFKSCVIQRQNEPFRNAFPSQLQFLKARGFINEDNDIMALVKANGNIQKAISYLCEIEGSQN